MLLKVIAWETKHRGTASRSDRSDKCPQLHTPDVDRILGFLAKYRWPEGPITVELSHREKPLGPKTLLDVAAYNYRDGALYRLAGEKMSGVR